MPIVLSLKGNIKGLSEVELQNKEGGSSEMKRNKILVVMLLAVVLAFTISVVAEAAKYELRFAGNYAPDHPGTLAQYEIAKEVLEKTKGEVNITVYPAGQLGDYTQAYEDVMRGQIDMGWFYITGQYNPMLEVSSLPYLATDWEELKRVFSPGSFWYSTYEAAHAQVGVKLLGVYVDSFISLATVKELNDPLNPEANKRAKIRIPPTEIYKITMDSMNFDTVTINWSDLYTAMQTGVCDGWIGGTAALNYFQFRDLIKHFIPIRAFVENVSYVFNADKFSKLPEEYQKIILEACQKQSVKSIDDAKANEALYQEKLSKEHNVAIMDVTDEQIEKLAAHVRENAWPKFEKFFGKETMEGLGKDAQ